MDRPVTSRVTSFKIQTRRGGKTVYEDIKPEKFYPVILTTYLALGGDGYTEMKENLRNYTTGEDLNDVLEQYIADRSPLNLQIDGRIVVKDQQRSR